ncbi:hypothetical protein C8Q73DRAFT_719351 [Cubamyces lactineus]|nr:hypothetical protein C8Q73DRAFT_719351 [Cubamyces lactineus]
MSDPTNMTLPLDVVYSIVEMLGDDPRALRHIALTSRPLLDCARYGLYGSIILSDATFHRAELLSRTLRADPKLGALVRSLKCSSSFRHGQSGTHLHQKPSLTLEMIPFHLLLNLRSLELHSIELRHGVEGFIAIVGSLPRMERLLCDTLVQSFLGPTEVHLPRRHPESPASSPPVPPRFPTLRELVVKHGSWVHGEFANRLLRNHRGSLDSLESITISFGSTAQALLWVPVIRAAGPRLRHVSISTADRSVRLNGLEVSYPLPEADAYRKFAPKRIVRYLIRPVRSGSSILANDHAYVVDNLSRCPALQTIHLKHHPDVFAFTETTPSDGPIEALCEALERRPPPWPSLRRLELWLLEREGAMVALSDELCARLARVLTDKMRLPHFGTLVLRVQTQFRLGPVNAQIWSSRTPSSQLDREAVVARWRRAFDAVERDPGVVLDVAILHSPSPQG